jgi:hypothetical protein
MKTLQKQIGIQTGLLRTTGGRNVERGGRDRVEGNDSNVGRMFERKEMLNMCSLAGKPTADTSTVVYGLIEVQGFSCRPKDDRAMRMVVS